MSKPVMDFTLMVEGLLALYGPFSEWWLVFALVAFIAAGFLLIAMYPLRNFLGRFW